MNWTSRTPIEGVKCIVETEGCVFPAHYINGTWWNTEKGFPIDGVKRWVVYPEGEEPNDYIAPEVLLKYVMQAYRESQSKLEATRELNRKLCATYAKTKEEHEKMKTKYIKMKDKIKTEREQSQKLKKLFERLSKLFSKADELDIENQTEDEFVA